MDCNISLEDIHAVEETLRYIERCGAKTTYDGLIEHLSWYWNQPYVNGKKRRTHPKGWMLEWIKCLTC